MIKFSTIFSSMLLVTSMALAVHPALADTQSTMDKIQVVKNSPAGFVPSNVVLAADQTFRIRIEGNPTAFDPQVISDHISLQAVAPIFDTLYRQSENGKYVPAAAESYSISPDGLTWTFKLRPQAKWQDGKPVVASDFVYSLRRLTDPKTASPYGAYLGSANVVNAADIAAGKLPPKDLGVTALDDYTLQIKLTHPTPWLLQIFSFSVTAPLRQDIINKYGDAWTRPGNLVGNGPFILDNYSVNDQFSYKKWDGYWNAKNVHLNKIIYYVLLNDNTAYLKYLSGALDLTDLPPSSKDKVLSERPDELVTAPLKASGFIDINNKEVPFVVRKALALLIDSKFLTAKILKTNKPSSILVPDYIQDAQGTVESPYFSEDMKTRRAQANQLLAQAGYTKENPFVLTLLFGNSPQANLASNALRAWIEKATNGKIIYKTNPQEPKSYFATAVSRRFQARLASWGVDYDQASSFYNIFLCNDPNNLGQYCSPEYDKIVRTANITQDEASRVKLYQQAGALLQKDLPAVPLYWITRQYLRNPRLGGYNPAVYPFAIRDLYIVDVNKTK